MQQCEAVLAFWGALVGFVGWSSCFRLVAPVSDWLLEGRTESNVLTGLVRLLLMLFGLFAVLLLLRISSSTVVSAGCEVEPKTAFGVAFMASLAGLVVFGVVRRLARRRRR